MKVEIYSDVVCPWCYIGERRFQQALSQFEGADQVEVVYRPYQLDPGAPTDAVPLSEYLERRFGPRGMGMQQQVGAQAAEVGIDIHWEQALAANTRRAHRLLLRVLEEKGPYAQRELAERLFDFHFTRGGDLSDVDQLAAEAAEVGMDRDGTAAWLASDDDIAEIDAAFARARELGIQAVPTFVFEDRWAVQGAQPVSTFAAALSEISQSVPAADGCSDDACEV